MQLHHRDLWDPMHLKAQLAARSMPEGKAFAYFLAIMAFDWLQFTTFRLSPSSAAISEWDRADALITFALTLIGLVYLFWRNGGVQGKDFLYRYFPLSFVVGWKFMVTASVALWLCGRAMQGAASPLAGWVSTALLAAFNLAMMLRIGQHLNALAEANAA